MSVRDGYLVQIDWELWSHPYLRWDETWFCDEKAEGIELLHSLQEPGAGAGEDGAYEDDHTDPAHIGYAEEITTVDLTWRGGPESYGHVGPIRCGTPFVLWPHTSKRKGMDASAIAPREAERLLRH